MSDGSRESIEHERARIRELDQELCALLAERMRASERIGRVKAQRGEPISVRAIEDEVLRRARAAAGGVGVSESVLETIFQAIVQGSIERQHRVGVEQRRALAERVLVVGASGGMGRWMTEWLGLAGHAVEGVDPRAAQGFRTLADVGELARFDRLVVAVPLAATPAVVRELVAQRPRGEIVEISSIKEPLRPALAAAAAKGVRVRCLHPMFGPRKPCYGPLIFALACLEDEAVERRAIEKLLAHPHARIVTMPFDEHDRRMGWSLGLAHLSGIAFGAALARSGLDPGALEECASTTYARQKATALSVVTEDAELYLDIQRLNPHREAVYAAAAGALSELCALVRAGDQAGFAAALRRARSALEGPA